MNNLKVGSSKDHVCWSQCNEIRNIDKIRKLTKSIPSPENFKLFNKYLLLKTAEYLKHYTSEFTGEKWNSSQKEITLITILMKKKTWKSVN